MTPEELASFNGQDGRRAYIAVNGKIYDVTESPLWENGLHQPDHRAGQDLTEELTTAPHVRAVIERFDVVGTLEQAEEQNTSGGGKMIFGALVVVVIVAIIAAIIL